MLTPVVRCGAAAAAWTCGMGVYKFADKYGANVDGYSPIFTPDLWSETGDTYKLGTKGLIAWCASQPLTAEPAGPGKQLFVAAVCVLARGGW